jgi:flagellar assembly protein FliH
LGAERRTSLFEPRPNAVRPFSEVVCAPEPGPRPVRRSESRLSQTTAEVFERAKEEGHREGFQQGYAEGFHRGMTDAESRVEELYGEAIEDFRGALTGFVARARSAVDAWRSESEERVAGIVMDIVRRTLCEELALSRESVVSIVRSAIQEVVHGGEVVVRVNPLDVGTVLGKRDEILAACSNIRGLEVVGDLAVECGCRIETLGGVVDAEAGTFLERLEESAA